MPVPYAAANLGEGNAADAALVAILQRDLRGLGYLAQRIDGRFGPMTNQAVRRLQWDLLNNTGHSTRSDGQAPVVVQSYNRGLGGISGIVDRQTAESMDAMLFDHAFPKLPRSDNPVAANRSVLAVLAAAASRVAPLPFLLSIFSQESGFRHFAVPSAADADDFVVVGLDVDRDNPDRVVSRGYGIGQYTISHHPPRAQEVADFILDPVGNARQALQLLREKFDAFLVGSKPGTQALDREAEHPLLPLRLCKWGLTDPRYMSGCGSCAAGVSHLEIDTATPLYRAATETYGDAVDYPNASYHGVPDRAEFGCDWPYAARRYNGDGPDSYNYQARILRGLLRNDRALEASA